MQGSIVGTRIVFPSAYSYNIINIRAGTINRLIVNQSILKHQTDYQKQNLTSINRENL